MTVGVVDEDVASRCRNRRDRGGEGSSIIGSKMFGSGRTLRADGGADDGPAIGTKGAALGVGGVGTRGGGRGY